MIPEGMKGSFWNAVCHFWISDFAASSSFWKNEMIWSTFLGKEKVQVKLSYDYNIWNLVQWGGRKQKLNSNSLSSGLSIMGIHSNLGKDVWALYPTNIKTMNMDPFHREAWSCEGLSYSYQPGTNFCWILMGTYWSNIAISKCHLNTGPYKTLNFTTKLFVLLLNETSYYFIKPLAVG